VTVIDLREEIYVCLVDLHSDSYWLTRGD